MNSERGSGEFWVGTTASMKVQMGMVETCRMVDAHMLPCLHVRTTLHYIYRNPTILKSIYRL